VALAVLGRSLRRWDAGAAATAHRYLTGSRAVRTRISDTYGVSAEILPSPPGIDPGGHREAVSDLAPGYFLVVARLLPYKNVAAVVEAFTHLPDLRLVVVGTGPQERALRAAAGPNVRFLGGVRNEGQLRWLYANCEAVVAAAYEDQGLIPLEAAGFGKPAAALRWGGFLDTVVEGETGLFFDEPEAADIARAVRALSTHHWRPEAIAAHAELYSEDRFIDRLHEIVEEELSSCG
jgi:glycosyltransferase involved in cell wall biosynthesis